MPYVPDTITAYTEVVITRTDRGRKSVDDITPFNFTGLLVRKTGEVTDKPSGKSTDYQYKFLIMFNGINENNVNTLKENSIVMMNAPKLNVNNLKAKIVRIKPNHILHWTILLQEHDGIRR